MWGSVLGCIACLTSLVAGVWLVCESRRVYLEEPGYLFLFPGVLGALVSAASLAGVMVCLAL